jgi:hypothetical protein
MKVIPLKTKPVCDTRLTLETSRSFNVSSIAAIKIDVCRSVMHFFFILHNDE